MAGTGALSGKVLVNGRPYTDRDFRRWGVYVMQAEPLLNTATVSPSLSPQSWSYADAELLRIVMPGGAAAAHLPCMRMPGVRVSL